MARTSKSDVQYDWEHLGAAYQNNAADLVGLDPLAGELNLLLTEVRVLTKQQAAQRAAVQQTTLEINERVARGRLLATRLRHGVKAFYGTRTEKVLEFGVRPFRKPQRPPQEVEVKNPTPPPAAE